MENADSDLSSQNDLFYFESDHLAIKGNKDYSELIKTLFILTAQRTKAIEDYDTVLRIKKKCLENPSDTLTKIKENDLGVPAIQVVADIPTIDWNEYKGKISESELNAIYNECREGENNEVNDLNINYKNTHSQPWTPEEQKRLEELLKIYPPEPIEIRRIKKIATALGNRTVKQVSSRLQKYFLKLHQAGLPVPGRIPKGSVRKPKNKVRHPNLWRPTSFFPEYNVSINLDDSNFTPGPSSSSQEKVQNVGVDSENYLLSSNYHWKKTKQERFIEKSDTEIQIDLLKRAKAEKLRDITINNVFQHTNYKCDYCQEEPIIGTRWHCNFCITESIDFCNDCLIAQLYSDNCHPLTHKLIVIRGTGDPDTSMSEDSDSASEFTNTNSEISDGGTEVSFKTGMRKKLTEATSSNRDAMEFKNENEFSTFSYKEDQNNVDFNSSFENQLLSNDNDLNNLSTQDISYNYLHLQTNLCKSD